MTKSKTTYYVVAGASVTVVRDGKRVRVGPGTGFDFTDEEIESIRNAVGKSALRAPVNEGHGRATGTQTAAAPESKGKKASAPAPKTSSAQDDDDDI